MSSGLCPLQLHRVQNRAVIGGLEQSLNLGHGVGEEAAPTNQVPGLWQCLHAHVTAQVCLYLVS